MPDPQNQALIELPPSSLLERAVASGAHIEVIERLMGLQERWQANRAKQAFDCAMATLRTELPPIVKSNTVDFTTARGRTSYKYEDLHGVTEALTPVMAKHGLSFRWRTQPGDPVTVTCIVSHREGHSEECALSAPRDDSGNKNAIQALGSAITYLQRYTLKAALGVAAAQDDDGQSAGKRPISESAPAPSQAQPAAAQAQTPARPAQPPREAKKEYPPDNWRYHKIHFGKNQGVALGELDGSKLYGWYMNWHPEPYKGVISKENLALRAALDAAQTERESEKKESSPMSDEEKQRIIEEESRLAQQEDSGDVPF